MTDAINYNELMKRADSVAAELLDNAETLDDAREGLYESCDWDWVIYYGMAMELCTNVPSDVLSDAEEMVADMDLITNDISLFGHAHTVAYWIVHNAVNASLERMIEEREAA